MTSFIYHLTHFPTLLSAVTRPQNFSIDSVEFSFCWVANWVRFKIMPSLSHAGLCCWCWQKQGPLIAATTAVWSFPLIIVSHYYKAASLVVVVVYLLGHALVDSGVGSDAPDLAGHALHALLALHHRHVDVLYTLHQRVLGRVWGKGKRLRTDGPSYKWRSDRRIWGLTGSPHGSEI